MTTEQWQQVRVLYEAVLEQAVEAQPAWLQTACADAQVRATILAMLSTRESLNDFLAQPLLAVPAEPDAWAAATGRRIGAYVLERELGRGGMGVVYLAARADDAYQKEVAIKLLWPGLPEDEKRFQRERQILAALEHPGIARLLDGQVTPEGWPYIVMEYVDGLPITDYCNQHWMDATARIQLLCKVCEAVEYAHEHRVIHRDLKPGNLLVTDDGTPRLLDFGIAKLLDAELSYGLTLSTQTGMRAMTPDYASPEQMRGEEITPTSDVYSLGVLLYELLTGGRPFRLADKPLHEAVRRVSEDDPLRPSASLATDVELPLPDGSGTRTWTPAQRSQVREGSVTQLRTRLQGDLDNIVLRALGKTPATRYPTVADLRADLERHLRHEPVMAREPTWTYRANRFVRRHRVGVALTTLALCGVLVGLGLLLGRTYAARQEALQTRRMQYVTQMQQAGRQWEQGGYGELQTLLTAWLPQSGQEDLRGWEWFYLWREAHRERLSLSHEREVTAVAYSPDGALLASAGVEGTIRLWERATGQPGQVFRAHQAPVAALVFAPTGHLIASVGADQQLRLWEPATGQERWHIPVGEAAITTVAFAPDQQQIAVGTEDALLVVQAATGRRVWTKQQSSPLTQVVFTPDGRHLLTAGQDEQLKRWEARTGQLLQAVRAHPGSAVFTVAVSPDGRYVASGGNDTVAGGKAIRLWEARTLREIRVLARHENAVRQVAFAPDSQRLVTVGADQRVIVWDVATGQPVLVRQGHTMRIRAVAFAPDGREVASGSDDQTVKLWNVDATTEPADVLRGHQGQILAVAMAPDSQFLATGSADQTARLWDVASGRSRAILSGHPGAVLALAFVPHEPVLLTGTTDATIKSWHSQTGEEQAQFSTALAPLAFTAAGQPIQALPRGRDLELQDLTTQRPWHILHDCPPHVIEVHCTADGQRAVTITEQGVGTVWELATGQRRVTFTNARAGFQYLMLSADGRRAVTETKSFLTEGWDLQTGQKRWQTPHDLTSGTALKLSRDGRFLLVGGPGSNARIVNAATGQLLTTLTGHTAPVVAGNFAADGTEVATVSSNGEVKLWQVATGRLQQSFAASGERPRQVAFLPEGGLLVTASARGELGWWERRSGQLLESRPGHDKGLVQMQLSPAGHQLLARDLDGDLLRYDLTARQKQMQPGGLGWHGPVQALAVSPDGQRLAVAHWLVVSLLDRATANQTRVLQGHRDRVGSVSFAPDGQRLATTGDTVVRVWETATGRILCTLTGHQRLVTAVTFSSDGQLLATASEDGTVRLWEAQTGQLLRTLTGHAEAVRAVAFTPDGRRVASGGTDKTVRLWEVQTGQELLTLRGHTDEVGTVAFAPDGQTLVSGSSDQTARVWRAATEQEVVARRPKP